MKQQINEIKRMQQLAGLNEAENKLPGNAIDAASSAKRALEILIRFSAVNTDRTLLDSFQNSIMLLDAILDPANEDGSTYVHESNQDGGMDLFDIINSNKNELAKKFNLDIESSMVSAGGDEDEPVQILDDNGDQVDFVKKIDWESNKGFYNNNQGTGEITLNGVDIIYIKNPY